MAKLEQIVGWLKLVDTDNKTLTIYPDTNVIHVQIGDKPLPPRPESTYTYDLNNEDELLQEALGEEYKYFAPYLGEKVVLFLQDSVVVNIDLA